MAAVLRLCLLLVNPLGDWETLVVETGRSGEMGGVSLGSGERDGDTDVEE